MSIVSNMYVPFIEQFRKCKLAGMLGQGELLKFKDHPERLPHPATKAARSIANVLRDDPDAGIETIACLRFGGRCTSANVKCRALRNVDERP